MLGRDTRRFTISSRGTLGGASGGAVLGEEGCYLGVITDADASEAHVTGVREGLALLSDPERPGESARRRLRISTRVAA